MGKELPNENEVRSFVVHVLAGFGRIKDETRIKPMSELKGTPLWFNDRDLIGVGRSLRGYIKHWNKNATLLVAEVRKGGVTVKGLAELVFQRIDGKVAK